LFSCAVKDDGTASATETTREARAWLKGGGQLLLERTVGLKKKGRFPETIRDYRPLQTLLSSLKGRGVASRKGKKASSLSDLDEQKEDEKRKKTETQRILRQKKKKKTKERKTKKKKISPEKQYSQKLTSFADRGNGFGGSSLKASRGGLFSAKTLSLLFLGEVCSRKFAFRKKIEYAANVS